MADRPVTYYVDKTYDSEKRKYVYNSKEIVLNLIDELLKPKYNKITFYCHNFGGFDVVFIKVILEYNDIHPDTRYKLDIMFRDNRILSIKISQKINGLTRMLTIKHSYPLLGTSLEKLGKDFKVETLKGIFPYTFYTEDNLYYVGGTPDRKFFNDLSDKNWVSMYKNDWSFKHESIKYLESDLMPLYQVITKANKQVFLDYGLNMIDDLTISKLALELFLSKYYNENIPKIDKPSMYNDIKQGYYGAITEVYKPYGEDLCYYDVNSLYPYVALQDMPGLICTKQSFYNIDKNIDDYFGLFYCEIETPLDSYLGLLPVRNNSGIEFPLGKWKGWYFSEELKFAKENGYKIKMLKGYTFNRESNVFNRYIQTIYEIKSNPKDSTQKSMAKSLLNNLLGRFGIHMDKPSTEIVNYKTMDTISAMKKVISSENISEGKRLITYINKLDPEIISSHNLDYIKILDKYKDIETRSFEATSVVISAAVTAYARIYISKIKHNIMANGGLIYYSDTDSIVTSKKLPDYLLSSSELGKLKLEHEIDKAIFISGKTYCLIDKKGNFINIAKKVKSSCLTYKDYLDLLNNKHVTTAVKTQSKTDWKNGFVEINNMNVTLKTDSYKKRIKIYDLLGKWRDTKPIIYNQLDLSLIRYIPNQFAPNLL